MRAAILGYGKSGQGARRLLDTMGCRKIDIYDDYNPDYPSVSEFRDNYEVVAVSPGLDIRTYEIDPDHVTSEIELTYEHMPAGRRILVVTGTNGKSTVTHLAAEILKNAGVKACACGNIGTTFADAMLDIQPDVYVVELSSFQIELLKRFTADGLVITNLSPDHLDRYAGYEDYVQAKLAIIRFLKQGATVYSPADERIASRMRRGRATHVVIDESLRRIPVLRPDGVLHFGSFFLDTKRFPLFGRHNILNLGFALLLADVVCSFKGDVSHLLDGLTGLAHRCEPVAVIDGVTWINDSKGTNVDSALTALESAEWPTTLILGGKDKMGDFTRLVPKLKGRVKRIIVNGDAAGVIMNQLETIAGVPIILTETLKDAVESARIDAEAGETVLFSPGCASFDQFRNFEERGRAFADYGKGGA